MSDVAQGLREGNLDVLGASALADWVTAQRWFGAKSRQVSGVTVLEAITVCDDAPLLVIALVEVRFSPGTHQVYQVPLGARPDAEGWDAAVVARVGGWTVYDALADPAFGRALFSLIRASADVASPEGVAAFRFVDGHPSGVVAPDRVRPIATEQSNSSIVFDEALVLKTYRRVEPGINPELELLRYLGQRGFTHVAELAGSYEYAGRLMDATLGVMQTFLATGRDGFELALDELGRDPDAFLVRVRRLGEITGEMHTALGSDGSDPSFSPDEPSVESLPLLTATIDEEIERVFLELPDDPALEAIAGRGEEVRERVRALANLGAVGRVIRCHGDYHLGQTLLVDDDWIVLDFEGEPARPIADRRRKRSPLRDVAGMLRSFAYAVSAAAQRGATVPDDWEGRARAEFLAGYRDAVDPSLLPPGESQTTQLLSVFELEKAVYELRYELNNRPEWVPIPVAGIARLLELPL